MQKLDVQFWVDGRGDVVTYTVEGDLKRPGEAVTHARELASEDGHDDVQLKRVRLAEPARKPV